MYIEMSVLFKTLKQNVHSIWSFNWRIALSIDMVFRNIVQKLSKYYYICIELLLIDGVVMILWLKL